MLYSALPVDDTRKLLVAAFAGIFPSANYRASLTNVHVLDVCAYVTAQVWWMIMITSLDFAMHHVLRHPSFP